MKFWRWFLVSFGFAVFIMLYKKPVDQTEDLGILFWILTTAVLAISVSKAGIGAMSYFIIMILALLTESFHIGFLGPAVAITILYAQDPMQEIAKQ